MEIFKKLWLVILFFIVIGIFFIAMIIYGSQIEEIKPGDGFASNSLKINIMASNQKWTDSGVSIKDFTSNNHSNFTNNQTQNIIKITGNISLCGGKEGKQKIEIPIHAVKCNNGSTPNYPNEQTLEKFNDPAKFYQTYNWNQLCANQGGINPAMNYEIIPEINISSGDSIKFSLINNQKHIQSCQAIPSSIFFSNEKNLNIKKCQELDSQNNSIERIISNDPSPIGNKYFFNIKNNPNFQWFLGSYADLRIDPQTINNSSLDSDDKQSLKDDLKKFSKPCKSADLNKFNKSETYEINNHCEFFARNGNNGVASYTKIQDKEYAELLIGKIGGGKLWGDNGLICIPNNLSNSNCLSNINFYGSSIIQNSIELNKIYDIDDNNIYNEPLYLILAAKQNQYDQNLGGYNISIEHYCNRSNAQDLYLYIGNEDPNLINFNTNNTNLFKLSDYKIPTSEDEFDLNSIISQNINSQSNPANKKLFFLIKDNGDGYQNNNGSYQIEMKINSTPTLISDIMKWLLDPIKNLLGHSPDKNNVIQGGIVKQMYENLIQNNLRKFIFSLLTLFIVITSLGFVLGITQIRFSEIVMIGLKIGLVLSLISDQSWNFLNKNFFNLFWFGSEYLINSFAQFFDHNTQYDYSAVFSFLDRSVGFLFNWKNVIRFSALFCAGFLNPISWFIFFAILKGLLNLLNATFKGIILYSTSLIISAFLIALAPIFICFILFKNTFQLFDTWVKQLIMYSIVPALFFIVTGFLNEIIFYSIFQIFSFGAYNECLLPISFAGLDICIINFPLPFANFSNSNSQISGMADMATSMIPVSIMHLIIFLIISKCYALTVSVIPTLSAMIFGGSPRFDISGIADSGLNSMKYIIGQDQESIRRRQRNTQQTPEYKKQPKNKRPEIDIGLIKKD